MQAPAVHATPNASLEAPAGRHGLAQMKPPDPFFGTKRSIGSYSDDLSQWNTGSRTMPDGEGTNLTRQAVVGLAEVPGVVSAAVQRTEELRADDRIAPDGKARMIRETIEQAEQHIREKAETAARRIDIAHAEFVVQAIGTVPESQAMLARSDFQLLLSNVPADRQAAKIAELAKRPDVIGQLAASSYGRLAMEASGASKQDIDALHRVAVQHGVQTALNSADDTRRQAPEQAERVRSLTGSTAWAYSVARVAGSELRQRNNIAPPRVVTGH